MQKLVRDKYEISASFVRDKCEINVVLSFQITTIFEPFFYLFIRKICKKWHTLLCMSFFFRIFAPANEKQVYETGS